MRLSDIISEFILDALNDGGTLELTRSELADRFNCVPSQINYVISTRFTPEHGFNVESRRGGGGYIRISRIATDGTMALMHAINSIGDTLSVQDAEAILRNLVSLGLVSNRDAHLIGAAVSPKALSASPVDIQSRLRASIFKNCLICAKTVKK